MLNLAFAFSEIPCANESTVCFNTITIITYKFNLKIVDYTEKILFILYKVLLLLEIKIKCKENISLTNIFTEFLTFYPSEYF